MEKDKNSYVVIMAGGIGSRFWPLSKKSYPKQFHDILGVGKSLLRLTYERYLSVIEPENINRALIGDAALIITRCTDCSIVSTNSNR